MRMKNRAEIINDLVPDSQVDIRKMAAGEPQSFWDFAPGSARKITSWEEAPHLLEGKAFDTEGQDMPDDIAQWTNSLEVVAASDIYETSNPSPIDHFTEPIDQWFVLEISGQRYLIDTEGNDYARYVWRLS